MKNEAYQMIITVIPIFFSFVSIVISIITLILTIRKERKNDLILQPRFSLEKDTDLDKNDLIIWKISNLGGAISNATIFPEMYILFSFYDEKYNKDVDITMEVAGYYGENFYYRNSDGSFYVKDDKQSALEDFIERYTSLICSDGFEDDGYRIDAIFTLHYSDYKGDTYNKMYKIVDDKTFEDDPNRKMYDGMMKQLEEVFEVPDVDISLVLECDEKSVISVNYKNAETQKIIENEQEYTNYLRSVILDLIISKDKSIEEMLGEVILSNGTLWRRDADTGELTWVDDNVKEFAFVEGSLKLVWITTDGAAYIME